MSSCPQHDLSFPKFHPGSTKSPKASIRSAPTLYHTQYKFGPRDRPRIPKSIPLRLLPQSPSLKTQPCFFQGGGCLQCMFVHAGIGRVAISACMCVRVRQWRCGGGIASHTRYVQWLLLLLCTNESISDKFDRLSLAPGK